MRLTWTLALLASLFVVAPALAQKPNVVGQYEPLSLESPHPYPPVTTVAVGQEVFFPGATYVRVHFSKFQLANGDWLEISNMARTEVYRYQGKGPHDSGEFWANTILGESALITLYARQGGGFGFDAAGGSSEWTEEIRFVVGLYPTFRGIDGSSRITSTGPDFVNFIGAEYPSINLLDYGFRIASSVPSPGSCAPALAAFLLGARRKRRSVCGVFSLDTGRCVSSRP